MSQSQQSIQQKFKFLKKLGEGTYGVVYCAQNNQTKEKVALKKLKLDQIGGEEGIPSTTIREINILKKANHPCIVKLQDVSYSIEEQNLYLVFDFIEQDLVKYIYSNQNEINLEEIKRIMYQLFQGIDYLHSKRIMHRDLKPQNILMTKNGDIKICDFGLSRQFSVPQERFTKEVATLWYRAPELMLGDEKYSVTFDIWALGCIMGELFKKKPIFQGNSQLDMIFKIFETFGTPTEESYPGVSSLPEWKSTFPKFQAKGIESLLAKDDGSPIQVDAQAMDLLKSCLSIDPNCRPTAKQALNHPFFSSLNQQ